MKNIISWHPPIFWMSMSRITPLGCGERDQSQVGHPGLTPEAEEFIMSYDGYQEECSYSLDERMSEHKFLWYSE